jgi:hypothetical protein
MLFLATAKFLHFMKQMSSVFISPEGTEFERRVGRKQDVWEMTAYQTASGLKHSDLKLNRRGNVVSKLRSQRMQERFAKYGGLKKPVVVKQTGYQKAVNEHKDRVSRHTIELQRQAAVRKKRKSPMKG